MTRGTAIRTATIRFVNDVVTNPNNMPIKQHINMPKDIDVFRIHIQAEIDSGYIQTTAGLATVIPYLAVNGQDDDTNEGIKLAIKVASTTVNALNVYSTAPSDILILDRRSTAKAIDELYLTAYRLTNDPLYNVLNANILFEGYL